MNTYDADAVTEIILAAMYDDADTLHELVPQPKDGTGCQVPLISALACMLAREWGLPTYAALRAKVDFAFEHGGTSPLEPAYAALAADGRLWR